MCKQRPSYDRHRTPSLFGVIKVPSDGPPQKKSKGVRNRNQMKAAAPHFPCITPLFRVSLEPKKCMALNGLFYSFSLYESL